MHPVLFHVFGYPLHTFGVLVALAFLTGFWWIAKRAKAAGEDENTYMEAVCYFIISAIVGARLFYIFFFPAAFFADPIGSLLSPGGLVWYGGMLGVIITSILFTRAKGLNFWKFGDIVAPPAALGLAIGRVGCLMAGCCYGSLCALPWAVHYPAAHETHGLAVHPTPLYESLSVALLAFSLAQISKRQAFPGQTTTLFFILYGLIRFILEYFRGDRLVWLPALDLSASQIISLISILAGVVMWVLLKSKGYPVEASFHETSVSSRAQSRDLLN